MYKLTLIRDLSRSIFLQTTSGISGYLSISDENDKVLFRCKTLEPLSYRIPVGSYALKFSYEGPFDFPVYYLKKGRRRVNFESVAYKKGFESSVCLCHRAVYDFFWKEFVPSDSVKTYFKFCSFLKNLIKSLDDIVVFVKEV